MLLGGTTLYTRILQENGITAQLRNLVESTEKTTLPLLKIANDNCYHIHGIQLQHTRAQVWHGSTKHRKSRMMYAHCGAVSFSRYNEQLLI